MGVFTTPINLKGIMVGNGCTDWQYDAQSATTEFAWQHNLVNSTTWENWSSNDCNAFKLNHGVYPCQFAYHQTIDQFDDIMIYDIYRPCINTTATSSRLMYSQYGLDPVPIPCVDSYGLD